MDSEATPTDSIREASGGDRVSIKPARRPAKVKAPSRIPSTAGDADTAPQPSSSPTRDPSVFATLRAAVESIEARNSTPAAAGVSARMRQLDPEFSPSSSGYTNFRSLLHAAEAAGIVHLDSTSADLIVRSQSAPMSTVPRGSSPHLWLRDDLWRALTDRTGAEYAYSTSQGVTCPVGPSGLRAGEIRVPSIADPTMFEWMHEFARNESGEDRARLEAVLTSSDALDAFAEAVRRPAPLARRWRRAFRSQATAVLERWATENGLTLTSLAAPATQSQHATSSGSSPGVDALDGADEAALRKKILDVLAAMPLGELLRLPIPVEYVLRR